MRQITNTQPMVVSRAGLLGSVNVSFWSRIITIVMLGVSGLATQIEASVPNACIEAATNASVQVGVPKSYLIAIARTESGRKTQRGFDPWPWALNIEGRGTWYASKAHALEAALKHLSDGKSLFDIGCFQINFRWHGENFASLDEMINPDTNAIYAAKFLKSLYVEFGDWTEAAGAYHSRTSELADVYKRRVLAHLNATPTMEPPNTQIKADAPNTFPFLRTVPSAAKMGSLVPIVPN